MAEKPCSCAHHTDLRETIASREAIRLDNTEHVAALVDAITRAGTVTAEQAYEIGKRIGKLLFHDAAPAARALLDERDRLRRFVELVAEGSSDMHDVGAIARRAKAVLEGR